MTIDYCSTSKNEYTFYNPTFFDIKELVDKATFSKIGKSALYYCFDPRLLWTIDAIRDYFGKAMTINNWSSGGSLQFRGFRPEKCTVGASFSQHKFGRAVDFNISGIPENEIRKLIATKRLPQFKYITRIEDYDGMNWVHIDVANYPSDEAVQIFVPKGKTSSLT